METLQQNLTQNFEFTINYNTLKEVTSHFDLGMGTQYKPIPVDGLVTKNFSGVPLFEKNKQIKIHLQTENESNVEIAYCKILNTGKIYNKDLQKGEVKPLNPWYDIFQDTYEQTGRFRTTPNGSLYISPSADNSIEITVQDEQTLPTELTYISFSIVFSLNIQLEGDSPKDYYFIIDPLAKVSSGVRP